MDHARRLNCYLSLFALLLAGTSFALADTENDRDDMVLQDRDDRLIAQLPNGMVVVAQNMPTAPVVSVQAWVKTGSIYEQEHIGAGLSHFLEHLASGGTTSNRSESQSNAMLGQMGAQTNAATSLDTVRYYINTTAPHTAQAVELMSDWLANSAMLEAEYERERDVIQREFEMGWGDPNRILWRATQLARYPVHPARHPTIGYLDEFLDISREQIIDFYHRMYVPNNMVFVVTGDIDKQAVVDQLASLWADVPARPLREVELATEPAYEPHDEPIVVRADVRRPRIRLIWPGTQLGGEGDYALDLLGTILGDGESSRLVQVVRDQDRLVSSIDAYNLSFSWGEGFFGVDAEVMVRPEENIDAAIARTVEAVKAQIAQVRDEPVSEEELARAKRKLLSYIVQSNQTAQEVASRLARDIINMQDPDYLTHYAQAIELLTAEQLQQAAEQYLEPNMMTQIQLLPLREGEEVAVQRRTVEAEREPTATQTVNLENDAMVEKMREHLAREHDVTPIVVDAPVHYTLDGGLRLIVQRSTVVPAVSMQVFSLGGLLADTPGREGVANAVSTMMRYGTTDRSADEIAAFIDDRGASLSTTSGNNTSYITATALQEDWQNVLALVAELWLEPSFPQDQWERVQPRLLAAIDRQENQWNGELGARFRETYFAGHPWSRTPLGREQVVASLTVDQLRDFHAKQLNPEQTVISVVGDVEPDAVRDAVESLFEPLAEQGGTELALREPPPASSGVVRFETNKPTTAVQIGFGPGITRDAADYPAMQVMNHVLSDFPSGYLQRALRGEGDGLVYAAWGYPRVGPIPGTYEIVFNTSAEDVPEAVRRALQAVNRVKGGGVIQSDLERAKARAITQEFTTSQSNTQRAMSLALDALYGVELDQAEYLEAIEAVTLEDVQRVADIYLNNPVVVILTRTYMALDEVEAIVQEQTKREE